MNARIIITLDPDVLDLIAKKGDCTSAEIKEALEESFVEELGNNFMFSGVEIEVSEEKQIDTPTNTPTENKYTNCIEEMANIIAFKSFEQAHLIDGDENLADIVATELYDKGYRKASEVAREIFAEIEKIIEVDTDGEAKFNVRELFEIEKKYTEN